MKKNTQILKNIPFFSIFLLLIIDIMAMVIPKCLKNLVTGQKLVKHWKVTKVKDAIFLLTAKYVTHLRILKNRVETRNCDNCKDSDPMFLFATHTDIFKKIHFI